MDAGRGEGKASVDGARSSPWAVASEMTKTQTSKAALRISTLGKAMVGSEAAEALAPERGFIRQVRRPRRARSPRPAPRSWIHGRRRKVLSSRPAPRFHLMPIW